MFWFYRFVINLSSASYEICIIYANNMQCFMQKNELFLLGVNGDNLVFLKKCYVQKKICYLRLCRELMQAKIGHCEEGNARRGNLMFSVGCICLVVVSVWLLRILLA